MQPKYEVAGVLRNTDIEKLRLTVHHQKTLRAIQQCRTQRLAAMWMLAMNAVWSASVTTVVVTGIVRSARVTNGKSGYKTGKQICCHVPTIMWYLLCRRS